MAWTLTIGGTPYTVRTREHAGDLNANFEPVGGIGSAPQPAHWRGTGVRMRRFSGKILAGYDNPGNATAYPLAMSQAIWSLPDGRPINNGWYSVDAAKADDNVLASVHMNFSFPGGTTGYEASNLLQAQNFFNLNLPANCQIRGIEATVGAYGQSSIAQRMPYFVHARLIVGGSLAGSDLSAARELTGTEAAYLFGGPNNLWGTTVSRSQAMASNFGLAIAFACSWYGQYAYVDYMRLKVYYLAAVDPTFPQILAAVEAGAIATLTNDKGTAYAGPLRSFFIERGTKRSPQGEFVDFDMEMLLP